jgi:N-acetylglutamate synthase-like GNAT family acetyltransferase
MPTPNLQARRANVEDLPKLVALWQMENLPVKELEQRFKEFQLLEDRSGEIVGAMGIHIAGTEGWMHHEAFAHPESADALRDLLWQRMQIMAKNHGLVRMWTQLSAPFWHTNGFQPAHPEVEAKRPAGFTDGTQTWLCVQFREESPGEITGTFDKEFAMFKEAERQNTERIIQQAKALKLVGMLIALAVLGFVIVASIWLLILRNKKNAAPSSQRPALLHVVNWSSPAPPRSA